MKNDSDPKDNEDLKNFLSTPQDDKPPLLFRRMKEDVLDSLPKKTIELVSMGASNSRTGLYRCYI